VSAIEKIKDLRARALADLKQIAVTELGPDEVWYFVPSITTRDAMRITAVKGGDLAAAAEIVLVLAVDDKGKRLFTDSHRADVESLPPALLGRIAKEMWNLAELPTDEDLAKK
jgi:hypothetical protein